jgi:MFS family permease
VIQPNAGAPAEAPNHPRAVQMGVIAGFSHNIIIGSIFGSFGVLVNSVQHRLNATPEMSAVAIPLVIVGSAILSSVAGVLAARFPLRLLMGISAALATCAWLILAFSTSYILYLLAYGLFLGPAMALGGSVLPPTLVTRWFTRRRGLALGLVHLPIVVAILPVVCNWTLEHYGASATYLMLAALCGLILLPATLLVVEHPPGSLHARTFAEPRPGSLHRTLTVPQLLARPRFWAFTLAVSAINTSSVILGAHLVPMALSWCIVPARAALLATIMSLVGIIGSVLFGWITDRIGGGRTLALIALDAGLLWSLLLTGPTYVVLALVVGLIGLHGTGAIPSLSRGLAEWLGEANFSRAFGLVGTASLPITVIGVMGTASVYQLRGSYSVAIISMIAYFAIAIPLGLCAARRRVSATSVAANPV